jgi:hypothetical protein
VIGAHAPSNRVEPRQWIGWNLVEPAPRNNENLGRDIFGRVVIDTTPRIPQDTDVMCLEQQPEAFLSRSSRLHVKELSGTGCFLTPATACHAQIARVFDIVTVNNALRAYLCDAADRAWRVRRRLAQAAPSGYALTEDGA